MLCHIFIYSFRSTKIDRLDLYDYTAERGAIATASSDHFLRTIAFMMIIYAKFRYLIMSTYIIIQSWFEKLD